MDYGYIIDEILLPVRKRMEEEYGTGTDLCGHCIEASEEIAEALVDEGFESAHTVEGWCLYDDGSFCSDVPWDPHTWVEFQDNGKMFYADVVADQFNVGMDVDHQFPAVILQEGPPYGIQYREPSWDEHGEIYTHQE